MIRICSIHDAADEVVVVEVRADRLDVSGAIVGVGPGRPEGAGATVAVIVAGRIILCGLFACVTVMPLRCGMAFVSPFGWYVIVFVNPPTEVR